MKIFLSKWFDNAVFTGEIISSTLITLIMLIIFHYFANKSKQKIIYTSIALVTSIFIGQGIANSISPSAPVFGIPLFAVTSSFFFNTYNLLPSILGAELAGTVLGLAIYLPYKIGFKAYIVKDEKHTELSVTQTIIKETIAQIVLALTFIYVTYATFNNGTTYVNISPLITTLISIVAITGLLFIFSKANMFLVSPFLSLVLLIRNFSFDRREFVMVSIQITIQTIFSIIVGFVAMEIKWW